MLYRTTILASILVVSVMAAANAQTTLRFGSHVPATSMPAKQIFEPWIDRVEEAAQGDVRIQKYWGGTLGRDPFRHYKLLVDGVVDIAFIQPQYTEGRHPDDTIFQLPFLVDDAVEGSMAYWRMYEKGLLRGYEDVKVISLYLSDAAGIQTHKPFKTLDDLKGMKIRPAGAIGADVLRQIGAVPVAMAITGAAEALDRRVLDGIMLNWGGILTWRTDNVTNHHLVAPLGSYPFAIVMNKQRWEGLSDKAKAAISQHSGEALSRLGGDAYQTTGVRVIEKLKAEPRHTVMTKDPTEIRVLRNTMRPVYDAWVKNTVDGQTKLETLEAILADIRKQN